LAKIGIPKTTGFLPQAQSHEIKPNIAIPYGYIVVFIQFAAIQVKKIKSLH